jgi:hypothetical protein
MKQIFFVLTLFAFSIMHAQTVNVSFSKKFSLRDHALTQKDGGTFKVGDFFFTMETDYKGMQLAYTAKLDKIKYGINIFRFDGDMKELNKVALDGDGKTLGPFPPRGASFNGKLLFFYYKTQDNGSIQLLYSVVDPETMNASPAKELYTISERNVGIFKLEKAVLGNVLSLAISPDNSKLLVAQSGNTNEVFTVVFDKDLVTGKPVISRVKGDLEDFGIQQAHIDNDGNKYFTYGYTEDKHGKSGVLLQNTSGKEAWLTVRTMQDAQESGALFLHPSKDNTKMYLYGICVGEHLDEGVFLTTADAMKLKLGNPQVFAYPPDLREKLHKMDYADKDHGNLSVKRAYYLFNELEDGTVALTGYPINIVNRTRTEMIGMNAGRTTAVVDHFAGPIVNIFIKNGKCSFGVIYRNQEMTAASELIAIPYKDKLVCIYNDSPKSIGSDDLRVIDKKYDAGDLVLAAAVVGNDGVVVSRNKIADKTGRACYFTGFKQRLSDQSYLVPLGQDKVNMMRYYTELEQWATVEVN